MMYDINKYIYITSPKSDFRQYYVVYSYYSYMISYNKPHIFRLLLCINRNHHHRHTIIVSSTTTITFYFSTADGRVRQILFLSRFRCPAVVSRSSNSSKINRTRNIADCNRCLYYIFRFKMKRFFWLCLSLTLFLCFGVRRNGYRNYLVVLFLYIIIYNIIQVYTCSYVHIYIYNRINKRVCIYIYISSK